MPAGWQAFVERAPAAPRLVVVGGGVGGVELALASAHRLRAAGRAPQIMVLDAGPVALPGLTPRARSRLLAEAAALGITVALNARPVRDGGEPDHAGRRHDAGVRLYPDRHRRASARLAGDDRAGA